MTTSIAGLRPHLQDFDFTSLFIEGLGWDHPRTPPLPIPVDGYAHTLTPVAHKRGFVVYRCSPDQNGRIPLYPIRSKIESQVTKSSFEHLIVFVDEAESTQIWQWVKRELGKPTVRRELPYYGGAGDNLLQRLQGISFSIDEEDDLTVGHVTARVGKSFDVEKVTKRFYDRFSKEREAFSEFIDGITSKGDRDWYASLMLNRMMFVYFIQKQGFLDGDRDYLSNKLIEVRQSRGNGQYQQFYRAFLLTLFHHGLGQPVEQRDEELRALLGDVPFLNGGLFDPHELEQAHENISIPDEAFERVFEFFDAYRWHLDERPNREDNEINPDVLGYIFEKYVNQKQMGAYYTKEDITGYISRNTIIPFLFDAARKKDRVAFEPGGGVWRLLQDDPDRYIYPAVGHGITWNARVANDPKRLDTLHDLPDEIAAGIDDVSKRGGWNAAAPDEFALPTETWREVVARRQRYGEVRVKLASGEVMEINDLITLNLDIEQFARDVIAQSEGPDLIRSFWQAIREVSVLDPTCGSGAFLFAALNILEPLYTACLEGMRGFVGDLEREEGNRSPRKYSDFKDILEDADKHPNERYYILKSIVLNNLYGVDIMEEATEICKLRLFLKLVAQLQWKEQIEPLPDIDFNIRAGNTLVGFTSLDAVTEAMTVMPDGQHRALFDENRETLAQIKEQATDVSSAATQFRWQQTLHGGEITQEHKADLRERLDNLTGELDGYLAKEYGIDTKDEAAYAAWRRSHQPFHWFAEFFGIMANGGFDVIIGNPPFVEYRKVRGTYSVKALETLSTGNLCYFVCEQALRLLRNGGYWSMVTPVASIASDRTLNLRSLLKGQERVWISSYSNRPAKLFDVEQRIAIIVAHSQMKSGEGAIFSGGFAHWYSEERNLLLSLLNYTVAPPHGPGESLGKANSLLQSSILGKLGLVVDTIGSLLVQGGGRALYFHNGPTYWIRATSFDPNLGESVRDSAHYVALRLPGQVVADAIAGVLNSGLFYIYFKSYSNCRDLTMREIENFPLPRLSQEQYDRLAKLSDSLMEAYARHRKVKSRQYPSGYIEYYEYYPQLSKPIIDEIDRVLAEH